jgi:PKD repeat protein
MIIASVLADIGKVVDLPPVANFSVATNALTATFTDSSTDSDGTIVAHAWNFGDGATSTLSSPSHTYLVQGSFNASETVTDNYGVHTSKTVAVKPVWPTGTTQLLKNPGFESGVATPWTISAGLLQDDPSSAYAGNWYAKIGFRYPSQTVDRIEQSLAIPRGIRSAALEFRMHVTTADIGTVAHDYLTVSVNDSAGTQLAKLASFSNLDASSGYVLHAFDLTPFIGQTVKIRLQGNNDASLPTAWSIDNVFVEATP